MKIKYDYSSPNFSGRNGVKVDAIIIHHTGGSAPGCINWLCDSAARVSAHNVITKAGDIYELVPVDNKAWHAGRGAFDVNKDGVISEDERQWNSRSIGIELESDGNNYTDMQLVSLLQLVAFYCKQHKIVPANILGHKEIAPSRKWDPGHFSMPSFRMAISNFITIKE